MKPVVKGSTAISKEASWQNPASNQAHWHQLNESGHGFIPIHTRKQFIMHKQKNAAKGGGSGGTYSVTICYRHQTGGTAGGTW